MGNCLKLQLKTVVDNDNLPKIGSVDWELKPYSETNPYRLHSLGVGLYSWDIIGTGHFYKYGTGEDLGQHLDCDPTSFELNIILINNVSAGDKLRLNNKHNLKEFTTIYADQVFKTDAKIDLTYLTGLTDIYFKTNNPVELNIEDLKTSPNISSFFFSGNNDGVVQDKVYGSIENLVVGLIANGRSSGTINARLYKSHVTINGSYAWCNDIASASTPLIITFNSATNVTCVFGDNTLATYDGSTWTYNS